MPILVSCIAPWRSFNEYYVTTSHRRLTRLITFQVWHQLDLGQGLALESPLRHRVRQAARATEADDRGEQHDVGAALLVRGGGDGDLPTEVSLLPWQHHRHQHPGHGVMIDHTWPPRRVVELGPCTFQGHTARRTFPLCPTAQPGTARPRCSASRSPRVAAPILHCSRQLVPYNRQHFCGVI